MEIKRRNLLLSAGGRGLPLVVLAGMVFVLAGGGAHAQIFGGGGPFGRKVEAPRAQTQDDIGVPVPVTGRIEVPKGQEVHFEIRAETKTPGASVEFLIRKFPTAGKIISLTSNPNARNRAIVTYYADPASGADADVFAFAARYRGGRYSSEIRYDIDLVGTGSSAEIVATEEVDFGEVLVGDEAVFDVTVQNMGSSAFSGQALAMPPWHLVEPVSGQITLSPRQSANVRVAFRPELTGETSYFLSFSRSPRGTTKLIGKGVDPFSVLSETVDLELDPKSNERRGVIGLVNHGEKPMRVKSRGSSRIEDSLEEAYFLIPGETTEIGVKLEGDDTAPFDGMAQFSLENGYTKTVRLLAPVVPGRLELTVPSAISNEVINFGQVEGGRSTERGITLTNRGGVSVPLDFHVPEPFRLLTNPGPQLAPLSSINLSIGLYPAESRRGMVDVTMNVSGADHGVSLRLLGNVVKPKGGTASKAPAVSGALATMKGLRLGSGSREAEVPPESGDAQAALPSSGNPAEGSGENGKILPADLPTSPKISPATKPGNYIEPVSVMEREFNPELRAPEDLTMLEADSSSVMIGWTAPPNSDLCRFEVERAALQVFPDETAPRRIWLPVETGETERIGRLVKAKIRGLHPAGNFEFRVVTVDENGRSSPASEVIVAETGLPMDWTYIYFGFGVLLVVGFVFLVRKVIHDRRPEVYKAQYADT